MRKQRSIPGQLRECNNRMKGYIKNPEIDVFLVLKTTDVNVIWEERSSSCEYVEVMYPDGFIAQHTKIELEQDSRIIK